MKKPYVIGISGASGAGKSWFAKKLSEELVVSSCIFTLDSYYKDVNYVNSIKYRHDNPSAIDFNRAYTDLQTLLNGKVLRLPIYDYDTHDVVSEKVIEPTTVIIVEGLFAFSDRRMVETMDIKVWIEAYEKIRFERRVLRDVDERGDTYNGAYTRILNDVEPAYKEFTQKNIECADCIYLNIHNNKLPLLINILKKLLKHEIIETSKKQVS